MRLRHMDPGVGASFGLSVLLVFLAAVALHPIARSPARPANAAAGAPKLPASTAANSVAHTAAADRTASVFQPEPAAGPAAASAPTHAVAERSIRPRTRTAARRQRPEGRPVSQFIGVSEGESISDVARRVYGSDDAVEALWLANRDQVARPETPLHANITLRRP